MATLEELQDEILQLKEDLRVKEEKITNLSNENATYKEHNIKLQEHNNKLFSRLTEREQDREDEKPHQTTEQDLINDIMKKVEEINNG